MDFGWVVGVVERKPIIETILKCCMKCCMKCDPLEEPPGAEGELKLMVFSQDRLSALTLGVSPVSLVEVLATIKLIILISLNDALLNGWKACYQE